MENKAPAMSSRSSRVCGPFLPVLPLGQTNRRRGKQTYDPVVLKPPVTRVCRAKQLCLD